MKLEEIEREKKNSWLKFNNFTTREYNIPLLKKDQRNRLSTPIFHSSNQLPAKEGSRRNFLILVRTSSARIKKTKEICKRRKKAKLWSVKLFRTDVAFIGRRAFCRIAAYNPFFFHFSFDNSFPPWCQVKWIVTKTQHSDPFSPLYTLELIFRNFFSRVSRRLKINNILISSAFNLYLKSILVQGFQCFLIRFQSKLVSISVI